MSFRVRAQLQFCGSLRFLFNLSGLLLLHFLSKGNKDDYYLFSAQYMPGFNSVIALSTHVSIHRSVTGIQ